MKDKIERGDLVTVWWTDGDTWRNVVFQSGPAGPGDTYHLLVNGRPVHLNGNSSTFETIELEENKTG